ncbi:hypothetical protein IH824_07785 [candidate division KSB1 bacterium]|nr:hypothetical protein [candidate division KSB1 bacterium]
MIVQAKDASNADFTIPDETLLDFSLDANGELYGNFIAPDGSQAKSLAGVIYGDANSGKVKYIANGERPDSTVHVGIAVNKSDDTSIKGIGSVVIEEQVIINVEVADKELEPLGSSDNKTNPNYNEDGPDKRTKIIDFSKVAKTTVTVKVTDEKNNPISNYSFTIQALVRQNSGGHDHSDNRPTGRFITPSGAKKSSFEGKTGDDGSAIFTYLSSGIGGIDSIFVRGKSEKDTANAVIKLKMSDFELLKDGEHYNLVGKTTTHPVNHYSTKGTIEKLKKLADLANADSSYILQYNDISLKYGGPFDISKTYLWNTPHNTHREGTNVDMRPWSADAKKRKLNVDYIEKIVNQKLKGQFEEEFKGEPNHHFHLTF